MPNKKKNKRRSKRINRGPLTEKDMRRREAMCTNYNIGVPDALPMQVKRGLKNKFTFAQNVALSAVTSSGTPGAEVDGAYYFYLGQLDQASTVAAMFDQYRILQVAVNFEAIFNVWASTTSGSTGQLYTALDYDDASSTSISVLRQKETCVTHSATSSVRRVLSPRFAVAGYSGTFASYVNTKGWIDSAYPNVQHYAVKFGLVGCTLTSTNVFNVSADFIMQCRQVQ